MDDVEETLLKTRILRIVEAIEATGCVIVNPNYNAVRGMQNGLILRSADKDWLISATIGILEHLESKKGHNDSE